MRYISTRGQAPSLSFEDVLLTGLASDGGLYVPEKLPQFSHQEIASWSKLNYADLAHKILLPFVEEDISSSELKSMVDKTYAGFSHKAVAPLIQLDHNEWVLELFHGPTLAFKDFALQLLGRLMDNALIKREKNLVIMGATSGDTGSAAIEGCKHSKRVQMFILHPHERVSEVQRRQMTTLIGDNIHNIAVRGNFDDCQQMVKQSFSDQSFLKGGQLGAVNSINWARIMAQIVYYFYAAVALGGPHRAVSFSVPTGNFGDIYAGYLAKKMGLPIQQLIVATNENDILHRCISANQYQKQGLVHTLSPSMDIMVSSNFERLLFDLYDRNGTTLSELVTGLNNGTSNSLEPQRWEKARELFSSHRVDDEKTCDVISQTAQHHNYLLDPHSAIGLEAGRVCNQHPEVPMVTLATAHPVKFPDAVIKAGQAAPKLPMHLTDLLERPERCEVLDNDLATVQTYMMNQL
ncbi:threonine synthase [Candidatus Njordibacter sp. Uisw_039]|jgi:threonine synthase|uniref:threonine synthase n=1 Tax=Candidatus Njordibacter sp. Uisw_039 TaxID=3230972 RepID=UPI003A262B1D|tara:strand:- start:12136 stop:13524 length:1389 start_codon:yes stop_codon:yes gene_type:complete